MRNRLKKFIFKVTPNSHLIRVLFLLLLFIPNDVILSLPYNLPFLFALIFIYIDFIVIRTVIEYEEILRAKFKIEKNEK